jgi:zinc transporter 9
MLLNALVIFGISLAGGCIPLVLSVRDSVRRSVLAVATGVLLGALFLHLLPELAHTQSARGEQSAISSLWMCVIAVVVGLGLADAILCRREGDPHGHEEDHAHHHVTASLAAFVGLSIHSFTEGLGLAGAAHNASLASSVFSSIAAHKAAESFSLSTIFALAHLERRKIVALQLVFALITPLGILLGGALDDSIGESGQGVLAAVTCGTFLFIGLCELLPDTFHRRERAFLHLVLVAVGVCFVMWFN